MVVFAPERPYTFYQSEPHDVLHQSEPDDEPLRDRIAHAHVAGMASSRRRLEHFRPGCADDDRFEWNDLCPDDSLGTAARSDGGLRILQAGERRTECGAVPDESRRSLRVTHREFVDG